MQSPPSSFSQTDAAKLLSEDFQTLLDFIANFQKGHTDRVTNLILQYLPQDFRGSLIRQQKERSDQKRKEEVEALVQAGCTIKEKYDLLWQQQMAKRESLKGLASASGVFKAVVSFVGGIPQVLLDFLEKINDDNGPLAEQRIRYGPAFYQLTTLSNGIHNLVATWWDADAKEGASLPSELSGEALSLIQEASSVYGAELKRVVTFMDEVFANSPFLIKPEGAMDEDCEKLNIAAGSKYEANLTVEGAGLHTCWQWRVDAGWDIDFEVYFKPEGSGDAPEDLVEIVARDRIEMSTGDHTSTGAGEYIFNWDNSFTWLSSKNLEFKIVTLPKEDEEGTA